MATIKIAGRVLSASREDRTITGLLLPFGEQGRTNVGKITATAGAVSIPEDVSTVTLNIEHDGTRPVGRATAITEESEGIVASFHVAATTAGDDLLVEATEGLRTGLSVEVDSPSIRSGALVGGELTGAAAVVRPAFPSAQLVASDMGEVSTLTAADNLPDEIAPDSSESSVSRRIIVVDGVSYEQVTESTYTTTTEPVATPTDGEPAADETPAVDAAEDDKTPDPEGETGTEGEEDPEKKEEEDMSDSTVKATATVPTGSKMAGVQTRREGTMSVHDAAVAMASAFREGGSTKLLATLADIVPANTVGMSQPEWLGELWSGRAYQRRIVPLFNQKPLTNYEVQGWRWKTKPGVGPYAGSKADVPSAAIETESVKLTAQRLAGAHDIDRKYRDFGDASFYESYFSAMAESYARLSDAAALADVVAEATEVSPGSVPGGVAKGMAAIIDGALSIIDFAVPTFAVVAKDLYRDIVLSTKDNVLGYLSAALGLEGGELSGFSIVPFGGMTTGTVLVGAHDAVSFHELGEVPIRVEAENIAKGGIDAGLFGYYVTNVHASEGLALVTTAA